MGPMGHGAYGPWSPWAIWTFFANNFINTGWILTKILLDIDINVFYLKYRAIFPRWLELKHISIDFKFCLLAGGRPPSCSRHAHLSESHNFQANR